MSEVLIYINSDNHTEIEVRFDNETVWLSLNQISELFNRDKSVISRHLKNIYSENELEFDLTVAKKTTVQYEGKRTITREIEYFSLDAIISVGYRVNSKKGVQFRQWATQRLKDYLINGIAVNYKKMEQLQQTIQILTENARNEQVELVEAKGLLEIIHHYTQSFLLLNNFDSNSLSDENLQNEITYALNYEEAKEAISTLKQNLIKNDQAGILFGKEKDESFRGTLQSIVQTFDGNYLYSTIEEQAANLLYLVIKNHPFSDGNKRIGAFLFIWFLEKNKHRFKKSGELKINDNGLTTLALLVAQSQPSDKDLFIRLIINLIKDR